ncbi:hypothetical protein KSX_43970 [Ktedonospora formicarum]|uniref:Uncharacterized protein n=1 Tax=Ktedonospora formicarum TaxID=2778364 RepID=A0A8J3I6E6_9CHLR|nr:hypothetical protein KSX_43970 [Ktedonospora formicarum]
MLITFRHPLKMGVSEKRCRDNIDSGNQKELMREKMVGKRQDSSAMPTYAGLKPSDGRGRCLAKSHEQ